MLNYSASEASRNGRALSDRAREYKHSLSPHGVGRLKLISGCHSVFGAVLYVQAFELVCEFFKVN